MVQLVLDIPNNPPAEVIFTGHSESQILFAEDQEQVDKALEVLQDLPNLKKLFILKTKVSLDMKVKNS